MRVVLYNFDDPDESRIEKRLSNGESLLERQIRMLKRLDIREVEIVGSRTLYEYGKRCITNRRDFKVMSLLPYRDSVSFSQDDMLLINSQLLFQQSVIADMTESSNQCQVLAELKEMEKNQRLCVRLDMDRIVEVSDQICGLDCAPIYPMVHISFKSFEGIKQVELEQELCYENNQMFLFSFVKAVAERTKDILLFEDVGMMKLVQADEDYLLDVSMNESDKEQRVCMKEPGSIVSIKEFLLKEGAERILVVHDDAFYTMPFKQLFALQDIVYEMFCISGKNLESQEEIKALVSDKRIDMIVSVGGRNALKVADMVRKDLFPEQKLYPELKLMIIPDFLSEDYGILADYLIVDDNIVSEIHESKKSKNKVEDTEVVFSPRTSLKKKLLKRVKKHKVTKKLYNIIFKAGLFKLYQIIRPVNVKWVVFEAYHGNEQDGYSCNPRAIYEAMLSDPDYFDFKFIWVFKNPDKFDFLKNNKNTVIVKRESRQYLKFCAKAGYIFTNTGLPRYIKPNQYQKFIFTWHGKPLKRIGCSFNGKTEGKRNKKRIVRDYSNSGRRLSILLSPAPVFTSIMADAYNLSPKKRQVAMLESGYPRNDYLFKYKEEDVLRIKMNLQIPLDKKVILYAPTWRPFGYQGGRKYAHREVLDMKKLEADLGNDCVLLCRLHNLERGSMQFDQTPGFLYDVSEVKEVNELYIISDLLISDYSGAIFDFAILKRPIVLFMYDLEEYLNDANGLNFDLGFLPGPIAKNQNELVEAIKYELDHFVYEGKYKTFNEVCNCLDGPDCARRTAKQIVEINPEISPKQRFYTKAKKFVHNISTIFRSFVQKFPMFSDEDTERIALYHNKYKGKRCFLIGNGPSLCLSDLNMLKQEYCFGCNMIYKIFDRTNWRPTFLCMSDSVVTRTASKELQKYSESIIWVNKNNSRLMQVKPGNLICVNALKGKKYFVHGNMSEYYVPSNATVMTFMIELAMYMGFSEIYLLGVDFTIGRSQNDHFINNYRNKEMVEWERKKWKNYFRGENVSIYEGQVRSESRALYAYQKLAEYANKRECKIYNATRGGNLEVFPRVDFDEVKILMKRGINMDRVIVFGASKGLKKVHNLIGEKYKIVAFTDNDQSIWGGIWTVYR